jgi:outer membrane biosynthesis protein TonB
MKRTCLIIFMAVFFFGFTNFVKAQTAQDFFHLSAQQYINGNFENAGQTIAEGLAKYPNDADLKALAELLKKKQEEQKQKQKQQQEQQEKEKQKQQAQKDKEKKEQEKKKEQQKQPADKNKMNKKEAEQILQALRENEKDAQKKKAPIKSDGRYVEKDW